MSWENEYKSKLTTAEKAVELIKSGNRVVIGHACAEPSYLVDAMVANAESYHDVEIVHMVAMGKAGNGIPFPPQRSFRWRHYKKSSRRGPR